MRVSGASAAFVHDSLSIVNVPRRCCRPGCPHYAVATLTFVYSDSTAVVGPLATARDPHSWDLCVDHAGPLISEPTHPDEDDLVALADAVREGGPRDRGLAYGAPGAPLNGFTDPHMQRAGAHATAPSSGLLAPPEHRSGRRRGHLRVLPDPAD